MDISTASGIPVKPDELNSLMEFDHVIRVHPDGTVSEPVGVYAPELRGEELTGDTGWRLLTGYTGRYGYNGPIMHPSEFVGGRLARDILEAPGMYVTVVAYDDLTSSIDESDDEPTGWAVAFRELPEDET